MYPTYAYVNVTYSLTNIKRWIYSITKHPYYDMIC